MKNILNPTKFIYGFVEKLIAKYQHLAHGKLIDVGCGSKPFKHIFTNIDSYYGVDIVENSEADLICDVQKLEIEDNSADTILSTQVIEHVPEPNVLMREISRICKKGGIVLLTAPFLCRIHGEPHDFFRFTRFGLKHLFEKNGFEIIAIEQDGGFFHSMTFLTNFYLKQELGRLSYAINPLIDLLYLIIRCFDRNKNYAFMYLVVAKKI
ncbi:MAG TPA: class I SAM-dependent methyltransferase [Sedimentisphaerales bacterium]|nr:class I SAM-dependent methyltransferase [Sedimentisphaerales bacterium]